MFQNDEKAYVIRGAARKLLAGEPQEAKSIIEKGYPFLAPKERKRRPIPLEKAMRQFFKDGFTDRYSGEKLINPGMLQVLSEKLPDVFPYQEHWKTRECHNAYWEFQPTIDHKIPLAAGGEEGPENWVTTSMLNNSIKANFTLEQLGWELKPAGKLTEWDGLSGLFQELVEQDEELLADKRIKKWYQATVKVKEEFI